MAIDFCTNTYFSPAESMLLNLLKARTARSSLGVKLYNNDKGEKGGNVEGANKD